MTSPYIGLSPQEWLPVTRRLIEDHPLSLDVIREVALETWRQMWQTRIGEGESAISLSELEVPATVVGYFFERLFAKRLSGMCPDVWRGQAAKDEKDLVCIPHRQFDTEIKSSGQFGTRVYGNRSYGKKGVGEAQESKPEKSGYYITVNFHGRILNLLRFGWIDFDDWRSQTAETGQKAELSDDVYRYKLVEIPGEYRLEATVGLLPGVGRANFARLADEGVETIRQLLDYRGQSRSVLRFKAEAESYARKNSESLTLQGAVPPIKPQQTVFPELLD